MPKRVISCRPDGTIKRRRRIITTDDKIARLVNALGIDKQEYKIRADMRLLTRVSSRTLSFLAILLCLAGGVTAQQKVTKDAQGNYLAVSTKKESKVTATGKTYTDRKGKKYPVYVTEKGRLFCTKVSAKTGKEYKYYLTEK